MQQMASSRREHEVGGWIERIDRSLEKWTAFRDDWVIGRCPDRLREAIQYALLAPGKRLRPQLVVMACEACGGDGECAIPAACAVEMIHTYSLIHDDLPAMDDDDLRRGRPSCHIAFDEATAILAGDALQALAFEVLARGLDDPGCSRQCVVELAHAAGASQLVGGQADDLAVDVGPRDLSQLEGIHRRKTGALLVTSLRMGGICGGASREQMGALQTYGECLGLAFQITDDLLDLQGSTTKLGKHTGKDAAQGKLTYPALLGVEASRVRAAELIGQAQGAIEMLGCAADPLRALAQFIVDRDR
ncbi:MAG: polyprenyl synthetase family protein [Pirellulaceae bacterium]|nr:polyprenyl synthetase family protein [Planctomycetales bacterium]